MVSIKVMVESKLLPGTKLPRLFKVINTKCRSRKCFDPSCSIQDSTGFLCKTYYEQGCPERYEKEIAKQARIKAKRERELQKALKLAAKDQNKDNQKKARKIKKILKGKV